MPTEPVTSVNQLSVAPTHKLTAATAAAGIMAMLMWTLDLFFPDMPNTELVVGLTPFAVFLAGYVVRDRPNIALPPGAVPANADV